MFEDFLTYYSQKRIYMIDYVYYSSKHAVKMEDIALIEVNIETLNFAHIAKGNLKLWENLIRVIVGIIMDVILVIADQILYIIAMAVSNLEPTFKECIMVIPYTILRILRNIVFFVYIIIYIIIVQIAFNLLVTVIVLIGMLIWVLVADLFLETNTTFRPKLSSDIHPNTVEKIDADQSRTHIDGDCQV